MGPMVEIPCTPEKDCGQQSYEGICCSYIYIRKDLVPSVGMFGVVHSQDMHNHFVDHLGFPSICGWKETNLVILVSIIDHRMDQKIVKNLLNRFEIMVHERPKRNPNMLEEELSSGLCCDFLLIGSPLRELVNNHKYRFAAMIV